MTHVASGKKVFFAPVPDEQLKAILTQTRGEILAVNMVAMFRAFREAGCEFSCLFDTLNSRLTRTVSRLLWRRPRPEQQDPLETSEEV